MYWVIDAREFHQLQLERIYLRELISLCIHEKTKTSLLLFFQFGRADLDEKKRMEIGTMYVDLEKICRRHYKYPN